MQRSWYNPNMGGYPNYGILDELFRMLSYMSPGQVIRGLLFENVSKKHGGSKTHFARKIYDLKKNGFIVTNGHQINLTQKGRKRIDIGRIEQLRWETKKQDGFYRLIMFDIPEKRRGARDVLRNKLQEFDCHKIQKSVYATPYCCEDILNELVRLLRIERFVSIVKAVHLGHEDAKIRKYFNK